MVTYMRRETSKTLLAATTHANEQSMSRRLEYHTRDAGHVQKSISKQDQVHRRMKFIVFVQGAFEAVTQDFRVLYHSVGRFVKSRTISDVTKAKWCRTESSRLLAKEMSRSDSRKRFFG